MNNISLSQGTCFIDGKRVKIEDCEGMRFSVNNENKNGSLFHNADGEVFYGVLKIVTIKPASFTEKIKSKLKRKRRVSK